MKNRIKNILKWILCGIIAAILTILCFQIEIKQESSRYILTVGCGLIAFICILTGISYIIKQPSEQTSILVIEDIFKMNPKGCVVVGNVQGSIMIKTKITIHCQNGNIIKTKIYDMEIKQRKTKVATNTPVAIYLKHVEPEVLHKGDILKYTSGG